MIKSLVLFDIEYSLMTHFEGITQLCNLYSVASKNNSKQKSSTLIFVEKSKNENNYCNSSPH